MSVFPIGTTVDTCTCALHPPAVPGQLSLSLCPNFLAKNSPLLLPAHGTKCCLQVRMQLQHLYSWAQSSVCNHGPNAFTTLSCGPSWQFLHSSTETRLSSPSAVLHPSNSPQAFQAYCPCFLRPNSDSAACSASL